VATNLSPAERASRIMRGNRKTGSRPELAVQSELARLGSDFEANLTVPGLASRVSVDIAFVDARLAVFIDGCFWHSCPDHGFQPRSNVEYWKSKLERNRVRDELVDRYLTAQGWAVLRIWEHDDARSAAFKIVMHLVRTPLQTSIGPNRVRS
jgi:DNA mismatch endonuclease (patch repair protein)